MNTNVQPLPFPSPSDLADPLFKEARERQRRRRIRIALLTVLVLGALVYGMRQVTVGSSAGPVKAAGSPVPSDIQACTLLTSYEVLRVVGLGMAYRIDNGPNCTWSSLPMGKRANTARQIRVETGPMTLARFKTRVRTQPSVFKPLKGLSAPAYLIATGSQPQLWAWKDGHLLMVSSFESPTPLKTDLTVARLALERL